MKLHRLGTLHGFGEHRVSEYATNLNMWDLLLFSESFPLLVVAEDPTEQVMLSSWLSPAQ